MREYKASKLRHVLFFTLAIFIGGAIGRIIIYRFIEGSLPSSIPSLIGSIAGTIAVIPLFLWLMAPAIERMNITITDDAISGPPRRGAKRVTIPLEKIDWDKSKRQNWFENLFGHRYIHSVDGETIVLSGYAFDGATMREILEQIRARTEKP